MCTYLKIAEISITNGRFGTECTFKLYAIELSCNLRNVKLEFEKIKKLLFLHITFGGR